MRPVVDVTRTLHTALVWALRAMGAMNRTEVFLLRWRIHDLEKDLAAFRGENAKLKSRVAVAEKTLPLYRLALQAIYAGVSDPQNVALQALSRGAEAEAMGVVNEVRN